MIHFFVILLLLIEIPAYPEIGSAHHLLQFSKCSKDIIIAGGYYREKLVYREENCVLSCLEDLQCQVSIFYWNSRGSYNRPTCNLYSSIWGEFTLIKEKKDLRRTTCINRCSFKEEKKVSFTFIEKQKYLYCPTGTYFEFTDGKTDFVSTCMLHKNKLLNLIYTDTGAHVANCISLKKYEHCKDIFNANGEKLVERAYYGEKEIWRCPHGYLIAPTEDQTQIVFCNKGNWELANGKRPLCLRACNKPSNYFNVKPGIRPYDKTKYEKLNSYQTDQYEFDCMDGYTYRTESTVQLTCINGEWGGNQTCNKDCHFDLSKGILKSYRKTSFIHHDETLELYCRIGYKPRYMSLTNTNKSMTEPMNVYYLIICDNGKLKYFIDGSEINLKMGCLGNICQPPDPQLHVIRGFEGRSGYHYCADGYSTEGKYNGRLDLYCSKENGTMLVYGPERCHKDCEIKEDEIYFEVASAIYKSYRLVSCKPGYIINNFEKRREGNFICLDGTFYTDKNEPVVCVPATCSRSANTYHFVKFQSEFKTGRYECYDNYSNTYDGSNSMKAFCVNDFWNPGKGICRENCQLYEDDSHEAIPSIPHTISTMFRCRLGYALLHGKGYLSEIEVVCNSSITKFMPTNKNISVELKCEQMICAFNPGENFHVMPGNVSGAFFCQDGYYPFNTDDPMATPDNVWLLCIKNETDDYWEPMNKNISCRKACWTGVANMIGSANTTIKHGTSLNIQCKIGFSPQNAMFVSDDGYDVSCVDGILMLDSESAEFDCRANECLEPPSDKEFHIQSYEKKTGTFNCSQPYHPMFNENKDTTLININLVCLEPNTTYWQNKEEHDVCVDVCSAINESSIYYPVEEIPRCTYDFSKCTQLVEIECKDGYKVRNKHSKVDAMCKQSFMYEEDGQIYPAICTPEQCPNEPGKSFNLAPKQGKATGYFNCAVRFMPMYGSMPKDSIMIYCVNGQWQEPNVTCLPTCLSSGSPASERSEIIPERGTAKIVCEKGFEINCPSNSTKYEYIAICMDEKFYCDDTKQLEAICEESICTNEPDKIFNIVYANNTPYKTDNYNCTENHLTKHPNTENYIRLYCIKDKWISDSICEPVCQIAANNDRNLQVVGVYSATARVKVKCIRGYKDKRSFERRSTIEAKCLDGEFVYDDPFNQIVECIKEECFLPVPSHLHVQIVQDQFKASTGFIIPCQKYYSPSILKGDTDSIELLCNNNIWEGRNELDICYRKCYPSTEDIYDAFIPLSNGTGRHGSMVEIKCKSGYHINNSESAIATCHNGMYLIENSTAKAICEPYRCSSTPNHEIFHVNTTDSTSVLASGMSMACIDGYMPPFQHHIVTIRLLCKLDTWYPFTDTDVCLPMCQLLERGASGQVRLREGQRQMLACQDGFELNTPYEAQCSNGSLTYEDADGHQHPVLCSSKLPEAEPSTQEEEGHAQNKLFWLLPLIIIISILFLLFIFGIIFLIIKLQKKRAARLEMEEAKYDDVMKPMDESLDLSEEQIQPTSIQ